MSDNNTNKPQVHVYVSTAGSRDTEYVQDRMVRVFEHIVALMRDRHPDATYLMMGPDPAVPNLDCIPTAPEFKEAWNLIPTVIVKMLASDWIFFDDNYKLDRMCRIEHFIAHEYNLKHLHMPEM